MSRDIKAERDAVEYLLKRAADFEQHAKKLEAKDPENIHVLLWRDIAEGLFIEALQLEATL